MEWTEFVLERGIIPRNFKTVEIYNQLPLDGERSQWKGEPGTTVLWAPVASTSLDSYADPEYF